MTLASPAPTPKMHVLFDLDGTLVDTRAAVVECYTRVFRSKLGSAFPPENFPIADLFAMRPAEVFAVVAPERIDELHAAYRDTYPSCTALIKVFAGIRELILDLVSDGRKPSDCFRPAPSKYRPGRCRSRQIPTSGWAILMFMWDYR